jgi:carbon-monoxide dehydrogenase small subunit
MQVTITINGEQVTSDIEPRKLLVHFVREDAGLRGTHWGCDTSNCGACTLWVDGKPVKSCTMLAAQADGHELTTVEGLEQGGELDPVQKGFIECHGLQCGFCTLGMVMSALDLVARHPNADEAKIREELEGNLCRCTGYHNIVKAVQQGAAAMRQGG